VCVFAVCVHGCGVVCVAVWCRLCVCLVVAGVVVVSHSPVSKVLAFAVLVDELRLKRLVYGSL
jgi:hypothetical protein